MQFSRPLKNLSLGLALISLSALAASAQSLSGVNARLLQPLNSQTAKQGEAVTARLDSAVTAGAVKLPKGAQLTGKISDVKASAQKGAPASITVVFTSAQLKDGKQIPVKATLVAAYPAADATDLGRGGAGPAPETVAPTYTVEQQPGALPGIELKASVKDADSGTFTKQNGNFTLKAGTRLQLGVGPAADASTTSAAE